MWRENEKPKAGAMAAMTVSIDEPIWQKINYWVQKAHGEVSGLGKIVITDGVFRVVEAILVNQENAASSTELDPASVARAMYELRDTPGHLNFWWHSHVNMEVFWSGTDVDTIREIGRHGFVVSTVFNKKREFLSSIYIKAGELLPEVFMDRVSTTIQSYLPAGTTDAWDKEYDAKCKSYVWKPIKHAWSRDNDDYSDEAYAGYYGGYGSYGAEPEPVTKPVSVPERPKALPAPGAGISSADPTLEVIMLWGEDMETEPDYKRAQDLLSKILIGLNSLQMKKELSQETALKHRADYVETFSDSRKFFRSNIAVEQKTAGATH